MLDSHQYEDKYGSYDFLFAAEAIKIFSPAEKILPQLSEFVSIENDWLFGHISYEIKDEIESISSKEKNKTGFEKIFFFQPDIVIEAKKATVIISSVHQLPESIFLAINKIKIEENQASKIAIQPRISKAEYVEIIKKLQQHILRGDCYEINFCQEFFAENISINAEDIYRKLSFISPSPFAVFYKNREKYLLCASPERFLKKHGSKIISQPMKGTIKRDLFDAGLDLALKNHLQNSAKDKSENVMVVDLVRNDFSKICKQSSVETVELFGIYSFPQVHQMVSTVIGEIKTNAGFGDILKATFPMGSMTGAPKKSVMELIDKYEINSRGIFSGSFGYIAPNKDFDFNVVIRSLMYNTQEKYLSYEVGGGITFKSNPEDEYEECLLKAKAIKKTLE